jgi:hypothetical protein
MNREGLKLKLDKLGVPSDSYSLYGGDAILKTTIGRKNGKWIIYEIDERGNHLQQYSFDTEEEVCEQFYQKLLKHHNIMSGNFQLESKTLTYKVTKKGDMIVFENGVPKFKNGVEICPENPIFLNGKPVLFDENEDVFDTNEIFHNF